MSQPFFTLGQVAKRFDVPTWVVSRIFDRGLLPPPRRAGILRIVTEEDMAAIESALRQANYLPRVEVESAVPA